MQTAIQKELSVRQQGGPAHLQVVVRPRKAGKRRVGVRQAEGLVVFAGAAQCDEERALVLAARVYHAAVNALRSIWCFKV